MAFFVTLVITGVSVGSAYALIAIGLNLTFLTTRTMNFGQGSIMMLCAMSLVFLATGGLGTNLAAIVAVGIAGLLGLVVERLTVRPALKQGGSMGWVVSTLGFGVLLQGLTAKYLGSQAIAFPEFLFSIQDNVRILGVNVSMQYAVILAIAIGLICVLELFLRRTNWGNAVRAMSIDPELARVQGIPVDSLVALSFLASTLLAGLAGILIAQIGGSVDPSFGFDLVLLGFVSAVLGGMGSSIGALAGGIIVGVLTKLVGGYISTAAEHGIAFALLMAILALKPTGLFGLIEARRA